MGLRSVCIGFRVEISVWFWCLGCWIWFGGFWRLGCWIWMVIWWRWWWWWVVSAAWVWFVNCGSNLWFMVMGLLVMLCWSWIVLLLLFFFFFFFFLLLGFVVVAGGPMVEVVEVVVASGPTVEWVSMGCGWWRGWVDEVDYYIYFISLFILF